MLIELIMYALVASFVAIVVLGHVLLASAIVQCVREDLRGGKPRAAADRKAVAADRRLQPLATSTRAHAHAPAPRRPSAGWFLLGWLVRKPSPQA